MVLNSGKKGGRQKKVYCLKAARRRQQHSSSIGWQKQNIILSLFTTVLTVFVCFLLFCLFVLLVCCQFIVWLLLFFWLFFVGFLFCFCLFGFFFFALLLFFEALQRYIPLPIAGQTFTLNLEEKQVNRLLIEKNNAHLVCSGNYFPGNSFVHQRSYLCCNTTSQYILVTVQFSLPRI